jgi:hypothetical protein
MSQNKLPSSRIEPSLVTAYDRNWNWMSRFSFHDWPPHRKVQGGRKGRVQEIMGLVTIDIPFQTGAMLLFIASRSWPIATIPCHRSEDSYHDYRKGPVFPESHYLIGAGNSISVLLSRYGTVNSESICGYSVTKKNWHCVSLSLPLSSIVDCFYWFGLQITCNIILSWKIPWSWSKRIYVRTDTYMISSVGLAWPIVKTIMRGVRLWIPIYEQSFHREWTIPLTQ